MAFVELVKNFDKIRDYMRDFYIYGFKARGDFTNKSARTYDNEKRRIESYLADYIKWESDRKGKKVYISLDTSSIKANPLYAAWKSKSFTDKDITLHFSLISALNGEKLNINEMTDRICDLTGQTFEAQTVRLKANEYVNEGLLEKVKVGRTDYFTLSLTTLSQFSEKSDNVKDAISFFSETAPFGFVGSTILDKEGLTNSTFSFKHHYIVHTLEDAVLRELLVAIKGNKRIQFTHQSARFSGISTHICIPLRIFASRQSGRRYVCVYGEFKKRFRCYRMDHIKNVEILDTVENYPVLEKKLDSAIKHCWGVSFSGQARQETLSMKLHIDEEKEKYVLDRVIREGRHGVVSHIDKNIYLYEIEVHDSNELMAWVKTFVGRIISLEGTNKNAIATFYKDMRRMKRMYGGEE